MFDGSLSAAKREHFGDAARTMGMPGRAGKTLVDHNDRNRAGAAGVVDDPKDRVARVYDQYASQVAAYALRRADSADAADVMAETFLVAWRRRDVMPDEPNTLPWLYGVARRVLANQRRNHRRRGRLKDRLEAEFVRHDLGLSSLEEYAEFRRVADALAELSDDDAELLRLTSWEGLSQAEVAKAMGIAPGTARQRVSRARQRLRKQLAKDGVDEAVFDGHVDRSCDDKPRLVPVDRTTNPKSGRLFAPVRGGRHGDR